MNKNYEALQCDSCGELDTISHSYHGAGYCTECYAIECYSRVEVDESGEIVLDTPNEETINVKN